MLKFCEFLQRIAILRIGFCCKPLWRELSIAIYIWGKQFGKFFSFGTAFCLLIVLMVLLYLYGTIALSLPLYSLSSSRSLSSKYNYSRVVCEEKGDVLFVTPQEAE